MDDAEEEDYMSDAFLKKLDSEPPGLVTVRSVARERYREEASKKGIQLSKTVKEAVLREEGLQKQVDSSNKGFGLLLKMGYQPGQGLGKNAEGRSEPVPIEIPDGRGGLGLASAMKERLHAVREKRRLMLKAEQEQFRTFMAEKFKQCRVRNQLVAIRSVCYQLDMEKSITVPIHPYYWPIQADKEDTETKEDTSSEAVQPAVPKRRRVEHRNFDLSDLPDVPPNPNREECSNSSSESEDETGQYSEELLGRIVRYLRRKHSFCFWCSVQYDSQEQLTRDCPGFDVVHHSTQRIVRDRQATHREQLDRNLPTFRFLMHTSNADAVSMRTMTVALETTDLPRTEAEELMESSSVTSQPTRDFLSLLSQPDGSSQQNTVESMLDRLATQEYAHFRHQSRDEAELSTSEKRNIAGDLYRRNPGVFLERFGRHLNWAEDSVNFRHMCLKDDIVRHFVKQLDSQSGGAQSSQPLRVTQHQVRNRRLNALKRLDREGGTEHLSMEHFSHPAMRHRDPVLWETMIGAHLNEAGRRKYLDREYGTFSGFLMDVVLREQESKDWQRACQEQEFTYRALKQYKFGRDTFDRQTPPKFLTVNGQKRISDREKRPAWNV
ncbi:coiled-coil domain-containing protein 75 [Clonorchis sinensis]|uniref:G patch domain-containing protein 11 n=1 Tax=Clonorchis sinensis TaxID=79923 RepID=G7YP43_CLOSI|nr:coiled-coil domain-containing protein 75 [Clonorchis sinensis]